MTGTEESENNGGSPPDVVVQFDRGSGVAVVEFDRPPSNFFDADLIIELVQAYESLGKELDCRAIVLASTGKNFCAGADFVGGTHSRESFHHLYSAGAQLFESQIPIVAAVQGRAVGGGLGLALSADFRVADPNTKFVCGFARLGIHHGFGISVTLPEVIGRQRALEMLCTGGTAGGLRASEIGLADRLADPGDVRMVAMELAKEIAMAAPLAVHSIRETMRGHLPAAVRNATERELEQQEILRRTADFAEGVRAAAERRMPNFTAT